MATAFISGHLDLTEDEFVAHYRPTIEEAVKRGDRFVVGDARGADTLAQMFLDIVKRVGHSVQVAVYHAGDMPRNNVGDFPTSGMYANQSSKDAAMTFKSDYDILWVRPGRENSGTARNKERRAKDRQG